MTGFKTLGINFTTIVALWVFASLKTNIFASLGLQFTPEEELALLGSLVAGINIVLRWFTHTPIFRKVANYGKDNTQGDQNT